MAKFTIKCSLNKKCILLTLLILCSLGISGSAFSQNEWKKDRMRVRYDPKDGGIIIYFQFYDFGFGKLLDGYLEKARFYYTLDGVNFRILMECQSYYQRDVGLGHIFMKHKIKAANLEFRNTNYPPSGTIWHKDSLIQKATVNVCKIASLSIKWVPKGNLEGVKAIAIAGDWVIRGVNVKSNKHYQIIKNENIHQVPYPVKQAMKSVIETDKYTNTHGGVVKLENHAVNITKEKGAIIIKGAISGEMIDVYSKAGLKIKSIVVNNDVVKIKLDANRIYFINVGQARYKMVL